MTQELTKVTEKPNYGSVMTLERKPTLVFQLFFDKIEELLNSIVDNNNSQTVAVDLPEYTVATVPTVTATPRLIYVSDEVGGPVMAFSDGVSWLRCTDRAIIS